MEELIALRKKLYVYKGRRREVLNEFGSYHPLYHTARGRVWNIQRKINRLEGKTSLIRGVGYLVDEFIGYNPAKGHTESINNRIGNKKERYARAIFYKYLIEEGVKPATVARYCKVNRRTPSESRRRFTRSFTTNKENLEMWRRWRLFLKHKKEIL